MTKREQLLRLSAAAVGLTLEYSDNIGGYSTGTPYGKDDKEWNPIEYNGQAFELAVKLGLDIRPDLCGRDGARVRLNIVYRAARLAQ